MFPGLSELLYDIELFKKDLWDDVREQISYLVYAINSAETIISNFGDV